MGTDGRAAGRVRSRDYQIFWDRWVDLLSYGALLARALHVELRYYGSVPFLF